MYKHFFKRLIDIILALLVLIILSPVLLITAIAIKIESPGPVIFKQRRLGLGGKEFNIYKFRSMVQNAEHTGSGVYSGKGDARVTKVGRIIRATSIDELPQAVNMLKGDMSLIGPRPPLTYHPWPIEEYTAEQRRMFDVRPGITGWAQVNGRKEVEWHRRIELNVWYVDHVSFWLDIKIFFMTIFKVATNADNVNSGATLENDKEERQLWPVPHSICVWMSAVRPRMLLRLLPAWNTASSTKRTCVTCLSRFSISTRIVFPKIGPSVPNTGTPSLIVFSAVLRPGDAAISRSTADSPLKAVSPPFTTGRPVLPS